MTFLKTARFTHARVLILGQVGTVLCWSCILAAVQSVGAQQKVNLSPELVRHPDSSIELTGALAEQIHGVNRNWLVRASGDNPGMLEMYRQRDTQPLRNLLAWSGEFAGKYLTACVEVLQVQPDAALQKHTASFVKELVTCQAADGYLGPFPKDHQLTGWAPNTWGNGGETWDLWGHYHVMLGLLTWHEFADDPNALSCAAKIGDLLVDRFASDDVTIVSGKNAEMNHAVVHSLLLLYRHRSDRKYLDLAEKIIREFSMPDAGNYFELGLQDKPFFQGPKPRWESLHPMMGLVEMYWVTGDQRYRRSFENLWWSITEFDRHNNGGFSSGEQAQGNPYHPGAIETCCTIAWSAMSVEMLKLTGDSRIADELELTLLNSVQGMHSADGTWSTYNTPMNGVRIPNTVDIAFQVRPGTEQLNCCSVNAARGFGLLGQWAIMNAKDGIAVNYFGESTLTTQYAGSNIQIKQSTGYPRNGKIQMTLQLDRPTKFRFQLRIPNWTNQASLKVNAQPHAAVPGQFASIDREWKTGDRIELELDMSLRCWVGENECTGSTSVYRGPILLAIDGVPNSPKFSNGFYNSGSSWRAIDRVGEWAEYDFIGDRVAWAGKRFRDAGLARILIDGKEVDRVDQYGETDQEPFQWSSKPLPEGPHRIRIEVLGEKRETSRGTFINIGEFTPAGAVPNLAMAELVAASANSKQDAFHFEVRDDSGTTYRIKPFAECGHDGSAYTSWIPIANQTPVEFSKANPLRLLPIEN